MVHFVGLFVREGAVNDASKLYQEALDCQVDEIRRAQIISKLSRVLAITDPMGVGPLESELQPIKELSISDIDKLEGSTKGTRRKDDGLKKRPATDGGDKVPDLWLLLDSRHIHSLTITFFTTNAMKLTSPRTEIIIYFQIKEHVGTRNYDPFTNHSWVAKGVLLKS